MTPIFHRLPVPTGPRSFVTACLALAVLTCGTLAQAEEDPISSARRAIQTGDAMFGKGLVAPACIQYTLAVGIAPEWWYSLYKKALCDMVQGDYRNAFYLLARAKASKRELYVIHMALARWYAAAELPDKAKDEYQTAIRLTKGAVEPMVELADLLAATDRAGEARLVLKRAEYFSPTNFAVRMRLARLSEQLSFFADAERELRFLATRGVNRRRALSLLARFYQRRGLPDLAQRVLQVLATPRADGQIELPAAHGQFDGEASKGD